METKVCKRCGEEKSLSEFTTIEGGKRHGRPMWRCIACQDAALEAKRLTKIAWRKLNGDHANAVSRENWKLRSTEKVEKTKAQAKRWRQNADPDKVWWYRVKAKLDQYGLTLDSYHALAEKQNFLCAVCGESPKPRKKKSAEFDDFVIDHDHTTGELRGLLCNTCNIGIGMLQDSPTVALSAAVYLEHHHSKRKTTAPAHVAA